MMDVRLRQIADHLKTLKTSAQFVPSSIGASLLPYLYVLDIERDADKLTVQLRIRLIGTAIDAAFGRPVRGHTLEEFIHGPRGKEVIAAYHHCAETHEPLWMRQVVRVKDKVPRFVEGVAIYLAPERIYGGLVIGEYAHSSEAKGFERTSI